MISILFQSWEVCQDTGKRKEQQDSYGFSCKGPGTLAVVCDGMGGMPLGRESSMTAVGSFVGAWEGRGPGDGVKESLVRSALAANDAVLEMAERSGLRGNTGTTLAAAVVEDGFLSWISVGDSRVYLFRERLLKPLSRDHNVAARLQVMVDKGELDPEEMISFQMQDALTSFIGIEVLEEYDLPEEPMLLRDGDMMLLCTDGLYNFLPDGEIIEILNSDAGKPEKGNLAESLVARVKSKRHPFQDNVTVLILRVREAG